MRRRTVDRIKINGNLRPIHESFETNRSFDVASVRVLALPVENFLVQIDVTVKLQKDGLGPNICI